MRALELLLADLESHQLVTVLVPCKRECNEGGMIRVNMSVNPKWYRDLCSRHPSSRGVRRGRFDTKIRRRNIVRALERMIEDKDGGKYGEELRRVAERLYRA